MSQKAEKAKAAPLPGCGSCEDSPAKRRGLAARPQRATARTDGEGADAPLGIYAKTAAAPVKGVALVWADTGEETGEVVAYERKGEGFKVHVNSQMARAERYALKAVVNKILPKSRTSKCMRWRVPKQSLQVLKSVEFNKAFYSGLQICASVWDCPICSGKITERRRVELTGAVAVAKGMGWQVMLLTCTVPHGLGDELSPMLDQMMDAWRKTTSNRKGKSVRAAICLEGTVRALEVTDGANGFHPHFHVLLFISSDVTTDTVQEYFRPLWQDACVKAGLPRPSDAHGVRVDDGTYAAAYASKWGIESELTKGHSKKGKHDSMTPWDLLRCYLATKCERSRKRFIIYSEAFKGRRQLYWSNGLKAKLGVGDLTDEELAHQEEERATLLSELTDDQWRAVLHTRSESALLDVAENHPEAFDAFLEGVEGLARASGMPDGPCVAGASGKPVAGPKIGTIEEMTK
ncbi:MAG: protein rep [Gallionella sp.]|nr:protein rep [Gallionella sp.]